MREKSIACPSCGRTSEIYLIIRGNSTFRLPVKKGRLNPSEDIALEPRLAGVKAFSASDKETRITFYPEEGMSGQLHCPRCDEAFDLSIEGTI